MRISDWSSDVCSSDLVERDLSAGDGNEAVFGGGKVIRESMGQSVATRADGTPAVVITGAVILDVWGVIKADIGIDRKRVVWGKSVSVSGGIGGRSSSKNKNKEQ